MIAFLLISGHPKSMSQSCNRKQHRTGADFFPSDESFVWKDFESLSNHID